MTRKLLLLPGDGIGPEVTAVSLRVVEHLNAHHKAQIVVSNAPFGGAGIESCGLPLPPETLAASKRSDAVLMGAVGGPRWDTQPYETRPEAGIIQLRKAMGTYANLRPAVCFDSLVSRSSLKAELVEGLDILFVRELTGGVYFGTPRGISELGGGERRAVNTQVYTSSEIQRVARVAMTLAMRRSRRLCSVEKSNVMETGVLWRQEVTSVQKREFPSVELTHMLADNCAMQLLKRPKQFDVILTDNLFGDLLSDEAGMLTGSIGMLPSAAFGAPGSVGLYEPVHGSAPDIAGRQMANPCASVLSLAMALRYSFDEHRLAKRVEDAVRTAVSSAVRTRDLGGSATTDEVCDAILRSL